MASKKIQIVIGAKDKTRAAFAKVAKAKNVLRKSVFNLKTGIGALVGVGGFVALARAGLKSIDNIGKLSRTLGLTTEQLGTLQHMANLGGTSLDTFARSVRNLNKGALDFTVKGTGEAKDAFERLGISVEDVNAASGDQITLMGLVADKLAPMKNGVEKTALAMKLFGSRSIEILPALEQGSAGIEAMREEAEKLGLILGKKAVAEVEEANDAMARLGSVFTALRNKIVVGLAPAITKFASIIKDKLVENLNLSGQSIQEFTRDALRNFLSWMHSTLRGMETFTNAMIDKFNVLKKAMGMELMPRASFQDAINFMEALYQSLEELPQVTIKATEPLAKLDAGLLKVKESTDKTKTSLQTFSKDAQSAMGQLQNAAVRSLNSMENAIMSLSAGTTTLKDSFKSMAISVAQDMQRMLIKKTITGPLGGFLDSALGSLFGGGGPSAIPQAPVMRARGGPLNAGQLSMVGERGPELFVPRTSGKIIANKDMAGGGVTVNNSFDFSNANPATVSLLADQAERIKQETFNNVFNAVNKGGKFARIVGRRS